VSSLDEKAWFFSSTLRRKKIAAGKGKIKTSSLRRLGESERAEVRPHELFWGEERRNCKGEDDGETTTSRALWKREGLGKRVEFFYCGRTLQFTVKVG